jgi:undecaprenyl-diphosphatase
VPGGANENRAARNTFTVANDIHPRRRPNATTVVQTTRPRPALTTETATFLDIFVLAISAYTFLRLASKIQRGRTESFDQRMLRALRRPENPAIPKGPAWLPEVAEDLTSLGSGSTLTLVTFLVVGALGLVRRFRAAGFLLFSLGSGTVLSRLLKNFFVRERPTVVPRLTHFDPGSFPSGHSMLSALVYLTLGGIVSRQTRGILAKAYFLFSAVFVSLLVGLSRMYLGVHYPSDVLAGWAAGSLWSTLCTQTARLLQRRGQVERPAEVGANV